MRRIGLIVPCLFMVACGAPPVSASVEELRDAVPSRGWLSMPLAASPRFTPGPCASSGASTFGTSTHGVAADVDGVLGGVFAIVGQITAQPPAARDAGQAMWGPITGNSSDYMLAVQKVGPTEFNFFLGGEPKGAGNAWQGVFGGTTTVTDAQHRSGEVDVNFTQMHALDSTVDPVAGGAAVRFTIAGAEREVVAHFGGIVGKKAPLPTDADYTFTLAADQTARFGFTTHLDFDHDGRLDELVQIQSRWSASGSGTARVTVSGGSLGARTVEAVECWDASLGRVYYSTSDANGASGDSACCPF